jgi:regulatory protein
MPTINLIEGAPARWWFEVMREARRCPDRGRTGRRMAGEKMTCDNIEEGQSTRSASGTQGAADQRLPDIVLLRQWALAYLARFSAGRSRVRQVIVRRIKRLASLEPPEMLLLEERLAVVLDRLEAAGVLDDRAVARSAASSMRARGRSARRIAGELRRRGLSNEDVAVALVEAPEEAEALEIFLRRKRLGPYRQGRPGPDGPTDEAARRKADLQDHARAVRAGFAPSLVRERFRRHGDDER